MEAEDLARRRKALGYSQVQLGYVLGVTQATISRWETGHHAIEHPEILDLALYALEQHRTGSALDVAPAELVKGEGDG